MFINLWIFITGISGVQLLLIKYFKGYETLITLVASS